MGKMDKLIRNTLIVFSSLQLLFAIAFFFQFPFATNLWPYPGTTPLTFIFVSSIFAAAAASTLWVVLSKNYGALVGISLDYIVILTPLSIFSAFVGARTGSLPLYIFSVLCLIGAFFGVGMLLWSKRFPIDKTLAMPRLVRWSFMIFIIALVLVSVQLFFQIPNVIPWKITPELSVVIGCMFFGAVIYFLFGFFRPSWVNAAGQLIAFLAYDLVLIVPFLQRLPTVIPEQRVGQIVYIAVLIYSGLLAIYYLFIHAPTRLRVRMPSGQ